MSRGPRSPGRAAAGWLILLGIALVAANLRPAAVSVGPVLAEIRTGLGLTGTTSGLLTSLPVIAFAIFGAVSPALARALGVHRMMLGSMVALAMGLVGRSYVDGQAAFLGLSVVALAGMASGNVLLPALVKRHFPDRVGAVTATYTTTLAVGLTASLTLTVPIADLAGTWRIGLLTWAGLAVVAAVPWIVLAREDSRPVGSDDSDAGEPDGVRASSDAGSDAPVGLVRLARTPLGLAMAGMFGFQALQAYALFGWFPLLWREAGYSPTTAGALVGLLAAVSIPLSFVLPRLAASRESQVGLCLAVWACYPIGYAMVLLAPYTLAVPAALVLGTGASMFPLVLTLVGLRARTAAGTAGLSALTQAGGYVIAAGGPLAVGALHESTGGWTVPVLLLIACSLPIAALSLVTGRPRQVEDLLPAPGGRAASPSSRR